MVREGGLGPLAFEPLAFEESYEGGATREERQLAAQTSMADRLILLKMTGKLSAKDVCELCYWAKEAGLPAGPVTALASTPGTDQTGHYNRHFNTCLGIGKQLEGGYNLTLPVAALETGEQDSRALPCLPAHELLQAEMDETPELLELLETAKKSGGSWSRQYTAHPVVQGAPEGEAVMPIGLFCDGVPFQKRDSALVFYVVNLLSGKRHLTIAIRTSEMCACGCKGWCTLYPVMLFIAWSLKSLAAGKWPSARHDGRPFTAVDGNRAALAGEPLMKAALVYILGDWAEISHTWGFPDWSSVLHPCFCCHAVKDDLRLVGDTSPVSEPFPTKDHAAYEEACRLAEKVVTVPTALVLARLHGIPRVYSRWPHAADAYS